MNILFIVPNLSGDFYKANYPHIGIAYMISYLTENGHVGKVVDMRVEPSMKKLHKRILSFNPEIIGITMMTKDYKKVYSFVDFIKEKYNRFVVIGGPHISLYRERALAECKADYAVYGEGEYAILALANRHSFPQIKNLIWRNEKKIVVNDSEIITELDALPFPDYNKFPLKKYIDYKIPIITSRGCPYSCIYCSVWTHMGKKWRARSPENIVKEIEIWNRKGYNYFLIPDDNFCLDKERVKQLCRLLIRKRLDIKWDLRNGIRVDLVDAEILKWMKEAGCYFLNYGVEAVDQEVLDASKKRLNAEKIESAIKITKELGMNFGLFFILGLPKDSPEKFKKILSLIQKYNPNEVYINNCIPYPKTEMEGWIKENGRFLIQPEEYMNYGSYWKEDIVFETPEFTKEERHKAYREAERIMWQILFKNEFGPILGPIAYPFYRNHFLRSLFTLWGFRIWFIFRKIKWHFKGLNIS